MWSLTTWFWLNHKNQLDYFKEKNRSIKISIIKSKWTWIFWWKWVKWWWRGGKRGVKLVKLEREQSKEI